VNGIAGEGAAVVAGFAHGNLFGATVQAGRGGGCWGEMALLCANMKETPLRLDAAPRRGIRD
jgi:hypothetical protein